MFSSKIISFSLPLIVSGKYGFDIACIKPESKSEESESRSLDGLSLSSKDIWDFEAIHEESEIISGLEASARVGTKFTELDVQIVSDPELHKQLLFLSDILHRMDARQLKRSLETLGAMRKKTYPFADDFDKEWAQFSRDVLFVATDRLFTSGMSLDPNRIHIGRALTVSIAYTLQEFSAVVQIAKKEGMLDYHAGPNSIIFILQAFMSAKHLMDSHSKLASGEKRLSQHCFSAKQIKKYLNPDTHRWDLKHFSSNQIFDVLKVLLHTGLPVKEELTLFNTLFPKFEPVLSTTILFENPDFYLDILLLYLAKCQDHPGLMSPSVVDYGVSLLADPDVETEANRVALLAEYGVELSIKLIGLLRECAKTSCKAKVKSVPLQEWISGRELKIVNQVVIAQKDSFILPALLHRYSCFLLLGGMDLTKKLPEEDHLLFLVRMATTLSQSYGRLNFLTEFFARLHALPSDLPVQLDQTNIERVQSVVDALNRNHLSDWLRVFRLLGDTAPKAAFDIVSEAASCAFDFVFDDSHQMAFKWLSEIENWLNITLEMDPKVRARIRGDLDFFEATLNAVPTYLDAYAQMEIQFENGQFSIKGVMFNHIKNDAKVEDVFIRVYFSKYDFFVTFSMPIESPLLQAEDLASASDSTKKVADKFDFKEAVLVNVLQSVFDSLGEKVLSELLEMVSKQDRKKIMDNALFYDCTLGRKHV